MPPAHDEETETKKRRLRDVETRARLEEEIGSHVWQRSAEVLRDYQFYSAVDLAWEPKPIAPGNYPLLQYAANKLDVAQCFAKLKKNGVNTDKFSKKDSNGKVIGVDLPKFYEVSINIVRSIITRRLAAISDIYKNLHPPYKYEARDPGPVPALRADIATSLATIMADQFGHLKHEENVWRDMLLYSHSIDFIRAAWETEKQYVPDPNQPTSGDIEFSESITKEGLAFVNPPPPRVFWDKSFPLYTINTDTGCEYLGHWDVMRYKALKNKGFWNVDDLHVNRGAVTFFTNWTDYFGENFPQDLRWNDPMVDLTGANDRQNVLARYSELEQDNPVLVANYFRKLVPKDYGIGEYPYPVWVRFVVGGWDQVMWAEFLPSSPACVYGLNQREDRWMNIGPGHELLQYQDQMSNLTSHLLLSLKSNHHKLLLLNTDVLEPENLKTFRAQAQGDNYYAAPQVLEMSFSKMAELGVNIDKAATFVEASGEQGINTIFQAMAALMGLVERIMALSPQEQGQPAPREISATETNLIAGTTQNVFNFIADSIDEARAAKKRIILESYLQFGRQEFRAPSIKRHTAKAIQAAGFTPGEQIVDPEKPIRTTVMGDTRNLVYEYVFTARDGPDRASNTQVAEAIAEVIKSVLPIPVVQENMSKGQFFDTLNRFFRLAGAHTLQITLDDEEQDEPMSVFAQEQVQQMLKDVVDSVGNHSQRLSKLEQLASSVTGQQPEQPSTQQQQPQPQPQ